MVKSFPKTFSKSCICLTQKENLLISFALLVDRLTNLLKINSSFSEKHKLVVSKCFKTSKNFEYFSLYSGSLKSYSIMVLFCSKFNKISREYFIGIHQVT